jgi:hypothetical protein
VPQFNVHEERLHRKATKIKDASVEAAGVLDIERDLKGIGRLALCWRKWRHNIIMPVEE